MFLPFFGQSNAGQGGNAGGAENMFPLFGDTLKTFLTGAQTQGPATIANQSGIQVLRDGAWQQNQMQATVTLQSLVHTLAYRASSISPDVIFGYTAWYGGQPLTSFLKGTGPYQSLVNAAAASGRACPAITFIQGESGPSVGYGSMLAQLADDIISDVKTATGQVTTPRFLVVQTGPLAVSLEQEAQEQARNIDMAGPLYHGPFVDDFHLSPVGRMIVGDQIADALWEIVEAGEYRPLRPSLVNLGGGAIDVWFSQKEGGINIDPDRPLGFTVTDPGGAVGITSAAVLAPNRLRLTLDRTIASGSLTYRAGAVFAKSRTQSLWYRRGFPAPEYVRHYSIEFQRTF